MTAPAHPAADWTVACGQDDLAPGEGVKVSGVCPPIAVFNVDGEFFAIDDTCTHSEYSLSDGYLDGDRIECELHFATFSVRTGEALTAPALEPVSTYPVRVEKGQVLVSVAGRCVISRSRA